MRKERCMKTEVVPHKMSFFIQTIQKTESLALWKMAPGLTIQIFKLYTQFSFIHT